MSSHVVDKDLGYAALKKVIDDLKNNKTYGRAGVLGTADSRNVEIAVIHEFGAPEAGIPERSFVRSSYERNKETYVRMFRNLLAEVFEGKEKIGRALGKVALKAATDIRKGVTDGAGIPPPLAPETIARKGSDRPLVDTGQMLKSITWDVVEGE